MQAILSCHDSFCKYNCSAVLLSSLSASTCEVKSWDSHGERVNTEIQNRKTQTYLREKDKIFLYFLANHVIIFVHLSTSDIPAKTNPKTMEN